MIFAFIIQSPAKLQWVEINLRINPRLPEIASTVELELKNTQYWDGQGLHSSVGLDDKSRFPQFIFNWLCWVIQSRRGSWLDFPLSVGEKLCHTLTF